MKPVKGPGIFNSLLVTTLFFAAQAVFAAKVIEVSVPQGSNVQLTLPEGWIQEEVKYSTGLAPTVRLHADKAKNLSLQMTFFEDKNLGLSTQEQIDAKLTQFSDAQYAPKSTEKKTTVVRIKSKNILGSYAKFSDARLATVKAVSPPEYRYITTGALSIGKTTGILTVLSNSVYDKHYKDVMNFLVEGVKKRDK